MVWQPSFRSAVCVLGAPYPSLSRFSRQSVSGSWCWYRCTSTRKFDTLDTKIERKFDTLDRKIDDLSAFLRDTVLEFKGEIGELRGAVRPHPPAQD